MEATVIDITGRLARVRLSRPENAADLVRAARQRLKLTQEDFAQFLTNLLGGWLVRPGFIEAWETGVAEVPSEVRKACREIMAGQLLGESIAGGARPADVGLSSAAADAREVVAWVESTTISDNVIDYLNKATIKAAEDHLSVPPAVMLGRVRQLHAMVTTLLRGGRQRIRQTRELLRVDAELLAHLCQLLGDVHSDQAASASGQAAMVLADEAGCSPATVFSAQAQIARWRHRHTEAADLAAEGFKRAAPAPLHVLLAYQEATAAAAAGQRGERMQPWPARKPSTMAADRIRHGHVPLPGRRCTASAWNSTSDTREKYSSRPRRQSRAGRAILLTALAPGRTIRLSLPTRTSC